MELFTLIAVLVAIAAILTWINDRINLLPSSIGVMLGGLFIASFVLLPLNPSFIDTWAKNVVGTFPLSELLLSIPESHTSKDRVVTSGTGAGSGALLGLLLFATAIHIEPTIFRRFRLTLITWLSTAGVVMTAFGSAALLWLFIWVIEQEQPYFIYMLLFGAILAPTDPVAIMDMFKKAKVATPVRDVIAGEALLNDATSIIMFLIVLALVPNNPRFVADNSTFEWVKLFGLEIGGGIMVGAVIGLIATLLIRTSRKNEAVVMLTLGAVLGTIAITPLVMGSVPIASVTCGLIVGRSALVRREETSSSATNLWLVVENALTTIIFLLVGLELLALDFTLYRAALFGLAIVPMLLVVRLIVVGTPWFFAMLFKQHPMDGRDVIIMSWCGLRGTVSLAMAVCIPAGVVGVGKIRGEPIGEQMLIGTFAVVFVTLTLQGLTLPLLVRFLYRKEAQLEDSTQAQ